MPTASFCNHILRGINLTINYIVFCFKGGPHSSGWSESMRSNKYDFVLKKDSWLPLVPMPPIKILSFFARSVRQLTFLEVSQAFTALLNLVIRRVSSVSFIDVIHLIYLISVFLVRGRSENLDLERKRNWRHLVFYGSGRFWLLFLLVFVMLYVSWWCCGNKVASF